MEEKRFETIEKIPTWALCYIINGDPTGLSDEDIKMVDGFMQKWQVEIVSPPLPRRETHLSRTIQPLDYLPRLRSAR